MTSWPKPRTSDRPLRPASFFSKPSNKPNKMRNPDLLKVPDGATFHGSIEFPCQELRSNGDICGRMVCVKFSKVDAYEIDADLDATEYRCDKHRAEFRRRIAQDSYEETEFTDLKDIL